MTVIRITLSLRVPLKGIFTAAASTQYSDLKDFATTNPANVGAPCATRYTLSSLGVSNISMERPLFSISAKRCQRLIGRKPVTKSIESKWAAPRLCKGTEAFQCYGPRHKRSPKAENFGLTLMTCPDCANILSSPSTFRRFVATSMTSTLGRLVEVAAAIKAGRSRYTGDNVFPVTLAARPLNVERRYLCSNASWCWLNRKADVSLRRSDGSRKY